MLDKKKLGKMIALRRKQNGLTQRQLADALHVSYQAVSRWELGTSLPTVEMLCDIASALDTSVDYLLKGEELVERDINYMDSGLNVGKLYAIKDKLQELVTEDENLICAQYIRPVCYKVDTRGMKEPVQVAKTYVPGSKLRLAREYGYDREICADLTASALNYTSVCGAKPLLFQPTVLCGANSGEQLLEMGRTFKDCCERENVIFAGMEVASQPVNFRPNEYELAAVCMGIADREDILDGSRIREGDVLIGIRTEGINGISYPFVRIMMDRKPALANADVGGGRYFLDELMRPTAVYMADLAALQRENLLHDAILLTNRLVPIGSLTSRLPEGLGVRVNLSQVPILPLYQFIVGQDMISPQFIPCRFHMGIGMIAIVPDGKKERAMELVRRQHDCVYMGRIEKQSGKKEETVWIEQGLKW